LVAPASCRCCRGGFETRPYRVIIREAAILAA
jgi:hypothetical protein